MKLATHFGAQWLPIINCCARTRLAPSEDGAGKSLILLTKCGTGCVHGMI